MDHITLTDDERLMIEVVITELSQALGKEWVVDVVVEPVCQCPECAGRSIH
jgi:hypothetical protein